MTAPRVYSIDRLPDNELGRCSDWIAGQSEYANFYDDPSTLPPSHSSISSANENGSTNPCAAGSFERTLSGNFESLSYDLSLPCAVESVRAIGEPCSQFRDCAQNGATNAGGKACQLGAVDVEDLALYFETEKSPIGCPPRIYRPGNSTAHLRRGKSTRYDPYAVTLSNENEGAARFPSNDAEYSPSNWEEEQFCNDCPQLFDFCTEERWLQCPASYRCPLYDTAYSYERNVLPPCAFEDFQREVWPYGYNGEDQLLDDYLSNEKRKEKSRDAARCRRSKETDIFTELAAVLPVTPEQATHLDKASVMRLAIAYLKVRSVIDSIPTSLAKSESLNQMDELFSKALNGFMLVLSSDGNMIYLSENVSDYLGVSQMDMMGQSVYEYSHPCDHEELRECLSSKPAENSEKHACSFFLRLKCTLTSKGRKVNLKSASYKVIHCTGRLTYVRAPASSLSESDDEERGSEDDESRERDSGASLVLLGCPIPHPSNIEIPLGRQTFLSKHNLSMKFTYADEKLAEYLGWDSEELMGQSVFEFYHALDNLALDKSFKSLLSKGQCETAAYRFLGKRGGYAWVVTQATLIHCSKQQKPLSIVCVNYVLSGVEREDEVYSARQLAARDTEKAVKPEQPASSIDTADTAEPPPETKLQLQVQLNADELEEPAFDPAEQQFALPAAQPELTTGSFDRVKPLTVTSSIFRAVDGKPKKEPVQLRDGSRKDNTFPRPVQPAEKSFVGVQALKESLEESLKESLEDSLEEPLEESLKENDEPKPNQQNRQPASSAGRAPFVFQGKPAVEYDSEAVRQKRPHVVTRHLFASLASQQQQQEQQISCRPPPQTTTASIFAPRTEEMNKGFLTFSEDQPGLTMLKDEPEDLTHLAPTPGDVCVPLEDTPFLSDMLDEFILGNDNYCPLLSPGGALPPELRSTDFGDPLKDAELVDPAREKGLGDSLADSDPFMYADSPSSPCSIDPRTVSPPLSKYRQSPEGSIDSLDSPTAGSGAEGLSEDEMLMLGLNDSIADDELALRAPYIPMSDQDEALDLLISNDMVMWSPPQTTDPKSGLKWMVAEKEQRTSDSSLAQLLKTDQVVSRKYNDHGGGLVNPVQVLGQIPRKNTNSDNCHWSTDKLDRPTKRVHAASTNNENDSKRIRCDESVKRGSHLGLEDHPLLAKQQPASKKSSNLGSSQLLRRLVSQQTILRGNGFSSESFEGRVTGRQSSNRFQSELELDEDDSGGGRNKDRGSNDGERCRRNGVKDVDATGQISQRAPSCNSVLMNLLVSGCDESLMNSRNVPTIYPKSLTTPLSLNLENHQMVPQCADSGGSNASFEQLSPAARKQLSNTFLNGGVSMVSPSSPMMTFDSFDYDAGMSSSGLLQVEPDLFGALLDRSLV